MALTDSLKKRGAAIAFAILTLVNIGGFVQVTRQGDDLAAVQQQQRSEAYRADLKTCGSANETRKVLLDLFNDLRPASEILRPGETQEQYQFRLDQAREGYAELNQRLAPRDCESFVKGTLDPKRR